MAAQLFTVPFQCVVVTGLAVPGATLTFYQTGTLTKLPVYTTSALTTQQTNPVVANGAGHIPNTYLNTANGNHRVIVKDRNGATLEDVDPYIPGITTLGITLTSATGQSVSTRGALAALSSPVANQVAFLSEAGREGMFVFDSSNLSTLVTADPNQGIFVAPASAASGASGAWVRKFSHPYANSQWWGHLPGIGDVSAAKQAAVDTLYAMRGYDALWSYGLGGSIGLYTPASSLGSYNMGSTTITVDHTMRLLGDSTGDPNGGGTVEQWDDNTGGYLFSTTAAGWMVEGIAFVGGFTDTESESHAIEFHVSGKVRDCYFYGWPGDALYESNDSGAATGNSNGFEADRIYVEACRMAHFAEGSDTNAGRISGLQAKRCRRWAVMQTGSLGTNYYSCSVTSNALTAWNTGTSGQPCSYVTYSGKRYFVIHGQETWASTHAPSGTTANNQGWGYWSAGGVAAGVPAWTNGITVRSGGGYLVDGLSNLSSFTGCYCEDDNVNQFDQPVCLYQPVMSYAFYVSAGVLYGLASRFGQSRIITTADDESVMRGLRVSKPAGSATNIFTTHNSAALSAGVLARHGFAQGYEADGVTPCYIASVSAWSSTNSPATAEGIVYWSTRTYGGGGTYTDWIQLNGGNTSFGPITNNQMYLGLTGTRWKTVFGYTGDFTTQVNVNGVKVLGAQGASVADATDAASAITQLNLALARLRSHGLIA